MTTKEYIQLTHKPMTKENKEKIIAFNRALVNKYPWLVVRNRWTGKVHEDYDYEITELDDLPDGWRLAFGDKICEEIQAELEKANYVNEYRILQIKEKWGGLRWYDAGAPMEVHDIINKYEALSEEICICCGKPATLVSRGWISYYCDECADKINSNTKYPIIFDKIEE